MVYSIFTECVRVQGSGVVSRVGLCERDRKWYTVHLRVCNAHRGSVELTRPSLDATSCDTNRGGRGAREKSKKTAQRFE